MHTYNTHTQIHNNTGHIPPYTETGVMWCFPVSRRSKAETDTGTAQTARSELSVLPIPVCSFDAILSQADTHVSS